MLQIKSMKPRTKQLGIRTISDAGVLRVPLSQHIGHPATPVVAVGDKVLKYQLIGKAAPGLSANIHSPVSGTVSAIENVELAGGATVPAIVIENNFKEEEARPLPGADTPERVVELIAAAGVVGEGGAQFPTAVKYAGNEGKIHTLILNGTECEPYLTADYALMNLHPEEILRGAALMKQVLKAGEVAIVIEEQNKALAQRFEPFFQHSEYKDFRVQVLPDGYPQGGELQVIRSVTGKELPKSMLPKDAGIVVNNVGTMYAIYQAVEQHRPVVSRIITVSGEGAQQVGNFEVKIGTPVAHILKELGINGHNKVEVMGGPMMGKTILSSNTPICKGSSGILLLKEKSLHRHHCISCGYCAEACPMHLLPMEFEKLVRKGRYSRLASYGLNSCIECAACEYVCPSNVALIESIKEGKNKLRQMANATK